MCGRCISTINTAVFDWQQYIWNGSSENVFTMDNRFPFKWSFTTLVDGNMLWFNCVLTNVLTHNPIHIKRYFLCCKHKQNTRLKCQKNLPPFEPFGAIEKRSCKDKHEPYDMQSWMLLVNFICIRNLQECVYLSSIDQNQAEFSIHVTVETKGIWWMC